MIRRAAKVKRNEPDGPVKIHSLAQTPRKNEGKWKNENKIAFWMDGISSRRGQRTKHFFLAPSYSSDLYYLVSLLFPVHGRSITTPETTIFWSLSYKYKLMMPKSFLQNLPILFSSSSMSLVVNSNFKIHIELQDEPNNYSINQSRPFIYWYSARSFETQYFSH